MGNDCGRPTVAVTRHRRRVLRQMMKCANFQCCDNLPASPVRIALNSLPNMGLTGLHGRQARPG
jgi:hypothetical protein